MIPHPQHSSAALADFGFVGVVGKPYRPPELLAELRRILAG